MLPLPTSAALMNCFDTHYFFMQHEQHVLGRMPALLPCPLLSQNIFAGSQVGQVLPRSSRGATAKRRSVQSPSNTGALLQDSAA